MAQATAPILDSTKASEAKPSHFSQLLGEQRKCNGWTASAAFDANDSSATLVVHCGSGFDARFQPYQRPRLSRYNLAADLGCGNAAT